MAVRVLDLFCGGGGSSYGARLAGAEIVCGVDASPIATSAFKSNFPAASAVTMRLTEQSRPSDVGDLGRIDLLLASPECTNHTNARGSRPREEGSRLTARYVLNFAAALAPRWIVVENVTRMLRWEGYEPLLTELGAMGYQIRVEELDASRFGVAQTRKRVFIVADLERKPCRVPLKTGRPPSASGILDAEGIWKSRPLRANNRAGATIRRAEVGMSQVGAGEPFLLVYYGSDWSGGWQPLDRPLRTITTLDRFGLITWDGDVPMLRMLQVPELQRAMGFGEDYRLEVVRQRRERIRILGNGVCPPVMEAIVRSLTAGTETGRSGGLIDHAPEPTPDVSSAGLSPAEILGSLRSR